MLVVYGKRDIKMDERFAARSRARIKRSQIASCAFLLLATCCCFFLWPCDNRLIGSVMDADSGHALFRASILMKDTGISAKTDGRGNFSLALPERATFPMTLICRYPGYKDKELVVGQAQTVPKIRLSRSDFAPLADTLEALYKSDLNKK